MPIEKSVSIKTRYFLLFGMLAKKHRNENFIGLNGVNYGWGPADHLRAYMQEMFHNVMDVFNQSINQSVNLLTAAKNKSYC